jgi:hypothetical protein
VSFSFFEDFMTFPLSFLEQNKLKSVDGLIFPNDNIFTYVDFSMNVCIDMKQSDGKFCAMSVSHDIMKKCGSLNETSESPMQVIRAKHKVELEKQRTELKEHHKHELEKLHEKIRELKRQLKNFAGKSAEVSASCFTVVLLISVGLSIGWN